MRRIKPESLGDILPNFLREEGLETPLNEWRLVDAWPKVAGEQAARHTQRIYIYAQTLYVAIASPALKANLQMSRYDLVCRLNAAAGAQVISDIRFL
ncbi:MAG: DUF721 domain-containing protein [Bacteroidales bacterium]|nr:DUF721 domain-containing protein [Candidatus Equimonas enterica]